jgi:nitrogen fixation NifU-like protein
MADLGELYQSVILDHNRSPRNFHQMEDASGRGEGYNPLCGDQLTVWLRLDGDLIADVSFLGSGCAISKASASLMTTTIKGKTKAEASQLFDRFHDLVTGRSQGPASELPRKLEVFSGVAEFPARVKCASLSWHALKAALDHADPAPGAAHEAPES